jgi:hypothetical protein
MAQLTVYLISDVGPVAPEAQDAWRARSRRAPATIARVAFPDDAVERGYASPNYAEVLRIRGSLLHRDMFVVEDTSGGETGGLVRPNVVQQ